MKTIIYVKNINHKMITGIDVIYDQLDRYLIYQNFAIKYGWDIMLPFDEWLKKTYTYGCNMTYINYSTKYWDDCFYPTIINKNDLWWANKEYLKKFTIRK